MSLKSPHPRSSQPLGPSTSRVGSSALTIFKTLLVACWPHPSLYGTQTMMLGALESAPITALSSRSQLADCSGGNSASAAAPLRTLPTAVLAVVPGAPGALLVMALGISCQTRK